MSDDNSSSFKPYIPAEKTAPELSISSIVIGIIMSIVFCAANAYLGLRVGSTISACIPISIISMGIYRFILKRNSILENNMVQTIGSVGEAISAGMIFTIPAMFAFSSENKLLTPSFYIMLILPLIGGILGILFMIPLRKALIVDEHVSLPYPEGTACAEVLIAAEKGGGESKTAFIGASIGAFYKFIADGLKLFPSKISTSFKFFKGAGIGIEALPALLGVGFIVGRQIACFMLAGAVLGWFVIIPLIHQFGTVTDTIIYPATVPISQLGLDGIWRCYLRHIGAGAVACSGIFNLIKNLPVIIKTFKGAVGGFKKSKDNQSIRTEKDLPLITVIISALAILLLLSITGFASIGFLGAILILFFGFFFSTVSSKMVGVVGVSNNPVSGMTIASLLITTFIYKTLGLTANNNIISVFCLGAIVCIVVAVAGTMAQSSKTGFLLGATPVKQQIGSVVGVVSSALVVGVVLDLLNKAWGFGTDAMPAPQAMLIKLVVEGVMTEKLPWNLVFVGVGIVILAELIGLQTMSFSIGLFLPIDLSVAIACGGFIRGYFDDKIKKGDESLIKKRDTGVLFSSGMIAGEGLVGILLAALAVFKINIALGGEKTIFNGIGTLIFFVLLAAALLKFSLYKKDEK